MRRFVKEFAAYEIKNLKRNEWVDPDYARTKAERIEKVVTAYEQELISASEACWCIANETR